MFTSTIRLFCLSAIVLIALSAFGSDARSTTHKSTTRSTTHKSTRRSTTHRSTTRRTTSHSVKEIETAEKAVSGKNAGIVQTSDEEYLTLLTNELLFGETLRQKLENRSIPDMSGSLKPLFGDRIDYRLTDIKVVNHDEPKANVTLSKVMKLEINVSRILFEGELSLVEVSALGKWPEVKGNLQIIVSGVSMKCDRKLLIPRENKESVRFVSTDCKVFIDDIELDVRDSAAKDLIATIDSKELKQRIADSLRSAASYLTDLEINFTHDRSKDIYLDMTQVKDPVIRNNRMETHHRGEMRHKDDKSEYKNWPEKLSTSNTTSMVQYDLSIFTFKTWSEVIHKHKLLSYVYKESDLPEGLKHLLRTKCPDEECFGSLFPKVSELHPDKTVEIEVSTIKDPEPELNENVFQNTFWFRIRINVKLNDYSRGKSIASFDLKMTFNVINFIKKHRVLFDFELEKEPEITNVDSKIGDFPEDKALAVASLALKKRVIEMFEMLKVEGIPLSSPPTLHVMDSHWERHRNALRIRLDYERQTPQTAAEDS